MQGFDFSGLRSDIAGLSGEVANGLYSINTNLLSGFAGTNAAINSGTQAIQSDICNMGLTNLQNTNSVIQAINADTVANMQNTYGLTTQLNAMAANQAECCCQTRQLISQNFADLNYNLASQACQNRQTVLDSARDIIDNQNANTRSILDFLVQDKIDSLNAENVALRGQVSQSEQNAYLLAQLRPTAMPAYVVANPYTGVTYTSYGCGYGSCGCNG